jgi:hypothetical protein
LIRLLILKMEKLLNENIEITESKTLKFASFIFKVSSVCFFVICAAFFSRPVMAMELPDYYNTNNFGIYCGGGFYGDCRQPQGTTFQPTQNNLTSVSSYLYYAYRSDNPITVNFFQNGNLVVSKDFYLPNIDKPVEYKFVFSTSSPIAITPGEDSYVEFTGATANNLDANNLITWYKPVLPFTSLKQLESDAITPINEGSSIVGRTIIIQGVPDSLSNSSVRMQVEVEPIAMDFTGIPNATSAPVMFGQTASMVLSNLSGGQYHWRARLIDTQGNTTIWQSENDPAVSTDFIVPFFPADDLDDFDNYASGWYFYHLCDDNACANPSANYNGPAIPTYWQRNDWSSEEYWWPWDNNTADCHSGSHCLEDTSYTWFRGIAEYVFPDPETRGFFSMWFKPDNFNQSRYWSLGYNGSNIVKIVYDSTGNFSCNGVQFATGVSLLNWHNIKVNFDSSTGAASCQMDTGISVPLSSPLTLSAINSLYMYFGAAANSDYLYDDFELSSPRPFTVSNVGQFKSDGTTPIDEGASTTGSTVVFQGTPTNFANNPVQLQIEVEPSTIAFTGTPTAISIFSSTWGIISVSVSNLPSGSYHWQARAIDSQGNFSAWQTMSEPAVATDFTVVNTFEPYPRGFKFKNIVLDMYSMTDADKLDVFNHAFDFSNLPAGENNYWHDQWYDYMFNYDKSHVIDHGECFGLSSLAALLYEKPDYVSTNFSELEVLLQSSNIKNLPWNLPEPSKSFLGKAILGGLPGAGYDASNISTKPLLEAIIRLQIEQVGDSVRGALNNYPTSTIDVFNELKNNFYDYGPGATNTKLYLMNIYSKDNNSGDEFAHAHTVLPYKINGNRIYVYDPNDPADNSLQAGVSFNHYIDIDPAGTATYLNSPNKPIFDTLSNIRIIPLENIYNNGSLPNMKLLPPSKVIFITGNSNLSFVDNSNNLSGFLNGQSYNQIKGVEPLHMSGLLANATTSTFQIPTAYIINTNKSLKVVVQGSGSGAYSLTSVKDNYLVTVSGATVGTSSLDVFNFSSSSVQAAISSADAGKTFSVILDNTAGGQDHVFTATTTPTASSTYTYSVNWNALSQGQNGVTLQIDSGNDMPVHTVQVGTSFSDNIAPITTPAVTGTLGQHNWYISNATVILNAVDNFGGVGVASIKYSFDNGSWQAYATNSPIAISTEGKHILKYFSTDYFGNQEAIGTLIIKIDKTAPEASVSVSTTTRSILVQGIDHIASTTVTKDSSGNYTVINDAGHTTKLVFSGVFNLANKLSLLAGILQFAKPTVNIDLSGNYLINNNANQPVFTNLFTPSITTYAQLTSVQYDSAPAIKLPLTHFFYVWRGPNKTLSNQTIFSVNNFFLQDFYDSKANQTNVYYKQKGSAFGTKKFIGLEILQLITSKGTAGFGF